MPRIVRSVANAETEGEAVGDSGGLAESQSDPALEIRPRNASF